MGFSSFFIDGADDESVVASAHAGSMTLSKLPEIAYGQTVLEHYLPTVLQLHEIA